MKVFVLNRQTQLQNVWQRLHTSLPIQIEVVDSYKEVTERALIVGLYDFFDSSYEKEVVSHCREYNISYMRANLLFETAIVGPLYLGKTSSCIDCFYERVSVNQPEESIVLYRDYNYVETSKGSSLWKDQFLEFVCQEVLAWVNLSVSGRSAFIENKVTVINDDKKSIHEHPVYKHEYCPSCGELPEDSEELATIHFVRREKPSRTIHRLKTDLDPEPFKKKMVDLKTGKTKHSYFEVESKYVPMVGTENYIESDKNEGAFGRTFDFKSSEVSAYLEGLERYSNVYNRKSNSTIFASYNEVKEFAVDPHELTLHDEMLMNEHFRLHQYSEDMKFHWVWGYSLKKKKPILIPEQMVFYKDEMVRDKSRRFVYETSNGCALGSTIEEAVLYGLFEVIERDNFLVSWYNRLQLVEIDIDDLGEDFRILNEVIKADGYEVKFFDTTMELGVPTVWALMVNTNADAVVKTYSAAGCHFNPEKALMSAFIEVVSSVPVYNKVFGEEHLVQRKNTIFEDGDKATEFQDHVLLYSHPDALERLEFLINTKEKKTLKELHPEWYETNAFKSWDLTEDLETLLHRMYEHYDDVYVVDITGDFIKSFDLSCVKVLVPGMLTMTFGHQHRRMDMDRILNGPVIANRLQQPIEEKNINPFPHPFP
ncbi:TOMM precursor leader peptide-binding protein [Sutcliffiella cohnii]|uniref:TOMM precursor leader peptide-binding protein n=1 Tax=Sutcliffiella cohnii TaxID=33932 RepID=UPI002E1E1BA6|nr:TOMM precursor leader peptide-binding protein [Sutcliffiella cohnii]